MTNKKEMWHLLHPTREHECFCGEKAANTIATDDESIIECPDCKKLIDLYKLYKEAKEYVLTHGYADEVKWCEQRKPFRECDAETFFLEYVYVILNAGMREQIARKIYERFIEKLNPDVIGHKGKREATKKAMKNYKQWFSMLQFIPDDENKIEFLKGMDWIGDITKYHLARNIGIDCVKPDRHLVRISNYLKFKNPLEMCMEIQKITKERLGVIDVIFWRYCNLKGSDQFIGVSND